MRAFIFDKYGYYEDDEYGVEFDYLGWHFKLEKVDKNENELKELNEFVKKLEAIFYDSGVAIIKNRDNKYMSVADFGNCALVSVKQRLMKLDDLFRMHAYFKNEEKNASYTIKEMQKLWEDKIDLLEEKILPAIKADDYSYEKMMTIIIYALGVAENALQYLAETILDYGEEIENLTLCHKRFSDYSSYEFFSPFNLIVDSPMRDLAELYKSNLINNERLIEVLNMYSATQKDVSILLARILYPTPILDLLDDYYIMHKDVKHDIFKYQDNVKEYIKRVSELEKAFVYKYKIRPINWLNL